MFELYKINRKIIKFCRNKFIEDINKIENGYYELSYNYINIIQDLINYDKIIDYLYNNQEYELIISNQKLFDYVLENLDKFENLVQYLIYIENFKLIYLNEILNEFIKNKFKLLVISIEDINNDYEIERLKESIQENFKEIKIIWI